LFAFAVEEVV